MPSRTRWQEIETTVSTGAEGQKINKPSVTFSQSGHVEEGEEECGEEEEGAVRKFIEDGESKSVCEKKNSFSVIGVNSFGTEV